MAIPGEEVLRIYTEVAIGKDAPKEEPEVYRRFREQLEKSVARARKAKLILEVPDDSYVE